tara:strand:- start:4052 stop:4156 length:105 start_codon:yes stop_codon:yes gene_type:complete
MQPTATDLIIIALSIATAIIGAFILLHFDGRKNK